MKNLQIIKIEIEEGQAILLDVREKKEWDEGHLKQARLFPMSELLKGNIPQDLPKNKKIYIHCRSGGRAANAEKLLKKEFDAIALKADFDDLLKSGF